MMKKLISLVCCLLPMGVKAAPAEISPIGANPAVSVAYDAWQSAIKEGQSVVIKGGNGIDATGGKTTDNVTVAPGFAVAYNMNVGEAFNPGTADVTPIDGKLSNLYVLTTATNPFTVVSTGDVSIGSLLQVLNGYELGFKNSDSNPDQRFNLTIGSGMTNQAVLVGDSTKSATLTLAGIDALTVNGAVIAYGDVSVDANSVKVGAINANAGEMNISSNGNVEFDSLIANAEQTSVDVSAGIADDPDDNDTSASIVSNGDVHSNNAGDITLATAGGKIDIAGNLENSSVAEMNISGGDLTVDGTMKNDNVGGTIILDVASLTVNGGDQDTYSFVNSGNFYATVDGATYFEYGLNSSGMQASNEFSLTTKTLEFGENAQTDKWFSMFANNLNKFDINLTDGDLSNLTTVLNGAAGNSNATMSISANNIAANSVQNDAATLNISADQNITIAGAVVGNSGETKLVAANTLTVNGAVSNLAKTVLNGNTVDVESLSNAGATADLTVSSLTETSGTVKVGGNVTNTQGITTIWAKNVDITGAVTNNSGTIEVRGSDSNGGAVTVGSVNAAGGVVKLDALAGNMSIGGALTVSQGVLNLGSSLRNLTIGGSAQIAGNLNAAADGNAGDVNVAASGTTPFVMNADAILIGGDINVTDSSIVRNIKLNAPIINVSGDATVENLGYLTLGTNATSYVRIAGDLTANNGGVFETFADDLVVGSLAGDSKFIVHGRNVTTNAGDINIAGNVYFDEENDPVAPTSGLVVRTIDELTLKTTADGADISVGAVSVGSGNTLAFNSTDAVNVNGTLGNKGTVDIDASGVLNVAGLTTNAGSLDVVAKEVFLGGFSNTGNAEIVSVSGVVDSDSIINSGSLTIEAATDISTDIIEQNAGVMNLTSEWLVAQSVTVSGDADTHANIDATTVEIAGATSVAGDFVQGGTSGMLNLQASDFSAANLTIGGDFIAMSGNTTYDIGTNISITGDINVADGAFATLDAGNRIAAADLVNAGNLYLVAGQGIAMDEITNNSGVIDVDSGAGLFEVNALSMNAGNLILSGAGMDVAGAIATNAMLYQNWGSTLSSKDINVDADDYVITTAGLKVAGINQDGKLTVNTSSVEVGGDIIANDLRFVANPNGNWMNVQAGSVSGDVDFIGLEKMTIAGNYIFNDGSQVNAAILPYAVSGNGINETDINYWASVSLNDDKTLGQITNASGDNVRALITVGGKFESDLNTLGALSAGGELGQPQIGIDIFDIVDQGTAIWFLHAEEGVADLATKIRNLNVSFCNADGSICMDYLSAISRKDTDGDGEIDTDINGSDEDLPAYISVRDVDENGVADSLYIVFDPRFGGPVEVFKIQPIVAREDDHTKGEYVSAGALDNMIAGQLVNKKFYNRTPIEVIPLVFDGTNLSTMANELYNRMEDYVLNRDGGALARFSRLFQVREIEQIAGAVALNEHTSFRSFEDRMFDEFIWNRHRNLNKAWLDVDYGMFYQNIDDGKHTDGHRFSVAGGFDWQESNTLVLGLTGRVSHTTSKAGDSMDLSYAGVSEMGNVKIDVADTNVGLGAYLMKILGEKARLYGNAFLDLHVFDVDRTQNFVDRIDGDGTAFSLMSEWGLMHDILNQYVIGNAYARVGYNFGFSLKEKVAGEDYMRLKSDGYFVLTPGYSLIAQKRIYPSAWFQIRPYASVGVEYDVFGAPDFAKYKFAVADEFTKYDIDIDPLWANIGGGVELLSARGLQFGIDYRYQYNDAIQLHNIKVSGSYRF